MSQVDQPTTPRPAHKDAETRISGRTQAAGARAAPTAQARYDFNAALDRARDPDERSPDPRRAAAPAAAPRPPRQADTDQEPRDPFGAMNPLHPFAALGGPAPATALAGADAMAGAAPAQLPVPTAPTGLGPESLAGQALGGPRQYSVSLPAEQGAALALRLTQTGASHWQLRLSADATTRQQLAPHVERLRDRLRQRQGRHTADVELEDDGGQG